MEQHFQQEEEEKSEPWRYEEIGREGNIDVQEKHQSVASRMLPTRDLACNLGMCPDWQSTQQPFSLQKDAQPRHRCSQSWEKTIRTPAPQEEEPAVTFDTCVPNSSTLSHRVLLWGLKDGLVKIGGVPPTSGGVSIWVEPQEAGGDVGKNRSGRQSLSKKKKKKS